MMCVLSARGTAARYSWIENSVAITTLPSETLSAIKQSCAMMSRVPRGLRAVSVQASMITFAAPAVG